MYKLITWVFLLNLFFRFIILNIDASNTSILFIISRLLLLVFIIYYWHYKNKNTFDYRILKSKKWFIISVLLIVICFLFIVEGKIQLTQKYLLHLIKCISVGGLEEFLFRYLIFVYFLEKFKRYLSSIFFVSLIFALFHISNLFFGSGLYSFIFQIETAFIIGLILQYIFLKTNNLIIVITIHALLNFLGTYRTLESTQINEYIVFKDFITSQILILVIYAILIPIYLWGLKINKYD
jgi:membrane protease YdiL (CAAX protease family)